VTRAVLAAAIAGAGTALAGHVTGQARRALVVARLTPPPLHPHSGELLRAAAARGWPIVALVAAVAASIGLRAPVLAALGLAAPIAGPRAARALADRRARASRAAQLPDALDAIASALRAGRSLHQAIGDAATLRPPVGPELAAVARRAGHGEALALALRRWGSGASADPDTAAAATALAAAHEIGGPIAAIAAGAAADMRERAEQRAELRALAAQARASAFVLVVAPVAVTSVLSVADPRIGDFLLRTAPGGACLVAGLVLDAAGAAWMARICRGPGGAPDGPTPARAGTASPAPLGAGGCGR
jgi:tight adherence protein B